MALLLLLAMLTACAATPQDLSGKMFTFPEETNTAYVKMTPSRENFTAVTVCLRFFTNLNRDYSLFSMASNTCDNEVMIYRWASNDVTIWIKRHSVVFGRQDFKLNTRHSVCSTWDSEFDLAELWFDEKPSNRRSVSFGSISGPIMIIVGQEQGSYGGGFDINQSFVGNISDVHMWDLTLSPCEIQDYMNNQDFPLGNVLNWSALEFQTNGRVLIQSKN